jgi:hypothetical protein
LVRELLTTCFILPLRLSAASARSTARRMDRFRLITAVGVKDASDEPPYWTSAAIAARLGVSEAAAERALRDAERIGLVVEEYDESRNVSPDFNRQLWRFSDAGRAEFFRHQDEHRAP